MNTHSITHIEAQCLLKMKQALSALQNNLHKIRTGRAHPGQLDAVRVEHYGCVTALSQLASISILDAQTLRVQAFDQKMNGKIEKSIIESNLGLNPSVISDFIRVPIPALNQERRFEMVKKMREDAETSKISVRQMRREANEAIKALLAQQLISKDEQKLSEQSIQTLTNQHIANIDFLIQNKEKEIMTI